MKVYKNRNVYDEALDRIRLIFDEFPIVVVSFSGGKDSTVLMELTIQVAKERNRLPQRVMWLDQECEFQATEDYVRRTMYREDVLPMWYQIPFRLLNATSGTDMWLNVWGEGESWAREQDPISIKKNTFGTDRFRHLLEAIIKKTFPGQKVAAFRGVRTEESPGRFMALTLEPTYKWITWGATIDKKNEQFNFDPLYDWSYIDIWKAIWENKWDYNVHYNELFKYGTPIRNMRVSNYHHETAVHSLFMLQEIEPETYERATPRISGLDTAGKMGREDWFVPELPFMFIDWLEYRDYLLENLIVDTEVREKFRKYFIHLETDYSRSVGTNMYRAHINSILCNDIDMTKLKNWESISYTDDQLAKKEAHSEKLARYAETINN